MKLCQWASVCGEKNTGLSTQLLSSAFLPATLLIILLLFCRGPLVPYSVPCFPLFLVPLHRFLIPGTCFAYVPSPELCLLPSSHGLPEVPTPAIFPALGLSGSLDPACSNNRGHTTSISF